MSSDPVEPAFMMACISLASNLIVLGTLYPLLPKTSKTGHLRFIVRFAAIWSLGAVGVLWAFINNQRIVMIVSDIVLLLGMVTMSAMWPHLAWLMSIDEKDTARKRTMDNVQTVLYFVCIFFLLLGILTNTGSRLMPHPYIHIFQVYFLLLLTYSIVQLVGPGWREGPAIDKRSRTLVAAAASLMFLFIVNDLILGIMLGSRIDFTAFLLPIAMALAGYGFVVKRKFLFEATVSDIEEQRPRFALRPGKIYYDLTRPKRTGPEVAKAQASRSRLVLMVTNRDANTVRDMSEIDKLPVIRFSSKKAGPRTLDLSSEEELEMVPWMVRELAFEVGEVKEAEGGLVVLENIHVISKAIGLKATKVLLKGLKDSVGGSKEVRLVLVGSKKGLGKRAKMVERSGFPLRDGK